MRASKSPATSRRSRTRSIVCALLAATLTSAGLTSCATVSSPDKVSLQLYQPRVLRLAAGQPVATRDGSYTPQVDETWHSDAAYRDLEAKLLTTAAALAQQQNVK